MVLTTNDANTAKETVANLGLLLRSDHAPGSPRSAASASGFSVHSPQLGDKPLVVAAKGERIAIGYGLPATLSGLSTTSSKHPRRQLDLQGGGRRARRHPDQRLRRRGRGVEPRRGARRRHGPEIREAKPYLTKVRFLAFGAVDQGDLATTKLIVGFDK